MILGLQPRSRGCLNLPPLQASGALHASQPVHPFRGLGATQLSAGVRGRRAGSPKLSYTRPSRGPRCHPSVFPPGRWGRRTALPPQRGQGGGGLLEPQAPLESLGAGLWVHQTPDPRQEGLRPLQKKAGGSEGGDGGSVTETGILPPQAPAAGPRLHVCRQAAPLLPSWRGTELSSSRLRASARPGKSSLIPFPPA